MISNYSRDHVNINDDNNNNGNNATAFPTDVFSTKCDKFLFQDKKQGKEKDREAAEKVRVVNHASCSLIHNSRTFILQLFLETGAAIVDFSSSILAKYCR